jgi:methanogenic corrinoid protein MtbC1
MEAMPEQVVETLREALVDGEAEAAHDATEQLLAAGADPVRVIQDVVVPALTTVGRRFQEFEIFLGELMLSSKAAEASTKLLQGEIARQGGADQRLGVVVIGTVAGDIHDIGKNIVATLLRAHGFEVVDLGRDVAPSSFLDAAQSSEADIVAMSSLMTTTSSMQLNTINLFREVDARKSHHIIVGGGCVNAAWADEIGADGYAPDAVAAVELCKELVDSD